MAEKKTGVSITYEQYGKLFNLSEEQVKQLREGVITKDPRIETKNDGKHLIIERIDEAGMTRPHVDQLLTSEQLKKIE